MTTTTLIIALLLAGYVAGLPVLLWGLADVKHIPGGVWRHAAQRPRAQWRGGMISAYAVGGWPVLFSVSTWRRSRERRDLLDEWAHLSRRKRQSRLRAREASTHAEEEPMIVLSEHDHVDEPARSSEPEREEA